MPQIDYCDQADTETNGVRLGRDYLFVWPMADRESLQETLIENH